MVSTVMSDINQCLLDKTDFLLSGGAGSGKTYTLIQTLNLIFNENPKASVACITYTNVAADEIKERSPYSKLRVSTIHDFLWEEIKDYQKNLKKIILTLIAAEKDMKGTGLPYSGETEITEESIQLVEYRNYRNLAEGIISHDDVLKVANKMFATYPLLSKILSDKFDYIFIDEYQDTQASVVEIFLEHLKSVNVKSVCIGFFGDVMQSIYATGVGNIISYIQSGTVNEIIKEDNYRCAFSVIDLLNKVRSDIQQNPAKTNADGSLANKTGSITFLYSNDEFDLDTFQNSQYADGWDFNDTTETKILFLTHRLNAIRLGFAELLSAYTYTDNLIGNEPDRFAKHLLKIGNILLNYNSRNFSYVIAEIDIKVRSNSDKKNISYTLKEIAESQTMTIHEVVERMNVEKLVRKDDRLVEYIENNAEFYDKVKGLCVSQIIAYCKYYNDFSPYSTQHGIKGAEFNNVLVVMDNGKWNQYNFQHYFEKTKGKESIIERTEKIFYVCCSRAKDNLIVYYPKPTSKTVASAMQLFGKSNVHNL